MTAFMDDFDIHRSKLRLPRSALNDLQTLLISETPTSDRLLCLSIILGDSSVNLRELAAYLNLIDYIYGTLSPQGIFAYSQQREQQLNVHEFRHGSVELEFIQVISNTRYIQALLLTFLILKYLPSIVESLSAAYKNYEEGRLIRMRRKMLRGQISNDPDTEMLSKYRKDQLTLVIDELLVRARRFLPKASRFSRTYVRKIRIRIMPRPESKPDERKVKNNHDE
jgi:hypothetical protein